MGRYDVRLRKCMDDGVTPRCKATVPNYINGWSHPHQCTRAGKIVRGGRCYCSQHDPAAVAERGQKQREKRDREYAVRKKQLYGTRFFAVLEEIAEGHNDPRRLAQETIDWFNED